MRGNVILVLKLRAGRLNRRIRRTLCFSKPLSASHNLADIGMLEYKGVLYKYLFLLNKIYVYAGGDYFL